MKTKVNESSVILTKEDKDNSLYYVQRNVLKPALKITTPILTSCISKTVPLRIRVNKNFFLRTNKGITSFILNILCIHFLLRITTLCMFVQLKNNGIIADFQKLQLDNQNKKHDILAKVFVLAFYINL